MADPGHLLTILCRNDPGRAIDWFDAPTLACARCCGLYVGAALGMFLGGKRSPQVVLGIVALGIAANMASLLAEPGLSSDVGVSIRLFAGGLLGVGAGAWLRARLGTAGAPLIGGGALVAALIVYAAITGDVMGADVGAAIASVLLFLGLSVTAWARLRTFGHGLPDAIACGALLTWSLACGSKKSAPVTDAPAEAPVPAPQAAPTDPILELAHQLRTGALQPDGFEGACVEIGTSANGVYPNRAGLVAADCSSLARPMSGSVQACAMGRAVGDCAASAVESAHKENMGKYGAPTGSQTDPTPAPEDSGWIEHAQPRQ